MKKMLKYIMSDILKFDVEKLYKKMQLFLETCPIIYHLKFL